MFKTVIFVASACVIATFLVSETTAEFGKGLFLCRNGTLAPTEPLVEKLKKCNDPEALGDKDPKCIAVCTTESVGGLKDGIPDKDLFINMVKTEFPEAEQANALERLEKCFENRTFDKEDKNCTSVADFSICGTKLVIETKC
ncbi:unnamed protein product [Orchesella dallaii]|uniref:Uncharacterized protein n=1 Tax=Orchesella dallaii TaxID=48710 RepID=A0ABP1Q8X6_9HEXA